MGLGRRQRRRTAWLVVLLFVLASVAPTLSRAMAFVQGQAAPWTVVCSATSGTSSPLTTDAPAGQNAHPVDHCPLCHLQQADPWALPPAAHDAPQPPLRHGAPWQARPAAVAAGPPRFLAQPRAPPFLR